MNDLAPKIEKVTSENLHEKVRSILQNLTTYESNVVLAANIFAEMDDYGNLTQYENITNAFKEIRKFTRRLSRLNSFTGSMNMSITFQYFRLLNIQTFIQSSYMQYMTYDYRLFSMWLSSNMNSDDLRKFWDVWMISDDVYYGLYLYTYAIEEKMANLLESRTKMIGSTREALPCGTWATFDPINDPDALFCNAFSAGRFLTDNMPTTITLSSTNSVG
jgi:hypothetical protein